MNRERCWKFGCVLLASLLLLQLNPPAESRKADEPSEGTTALGGLDPVHLTKGKEVPGLKAHGVVRGEYRYLFADEANRRVFEKEPSRYEVQLRGQCVAMRSAKGDPAIFAVHGGRIYLCGSPDCRERFLAAPAKFLRLRKNVAIFVHQGVELLDFAGPGEVFAAAGDGRAFHVYTVATSREMILCEGFLSVKPEFTLNDCPKPDVLVLPGGSTHVPLRNAKVIDWVKKTAPETEVTLSVCTGAFLLAKAGLLDGKEATTHWASVAALKKQYPKTVVHSDRRYVDNGKFVTAAGVSAGIDGSLHVVSRLLGEQAAKDTARFMEYKWERAAEKAK